MWGEGAWREAAPSNFLQLLPRKRAEIPLNQNCATFYILIRAARSNAATSGALHATRYLCLWAKIDLAAARANKVRLLNAEWAPECFRACSQQIVFGAGGPISGGYMAALLAARRSDLKVIDDCGGEREQVTPIKCRVLLGPK